MKINKTITGQVVKRTPLHIEKFNEVTRKSTDAIIENNAVSIKFYFDVDNEIVTFCTRQKFGEIQFVDAFKGLINENMKDIEFEVMLLTDNTTIKDKLSSAYKITKIKSVFVPPNVNEELLAELYQKNVSSMEEANVTKKTNIFESANKNVKGINIESQLIEDIIGTNEAQVMYKNGYAKIEAEGKNEDGSVFRYSSEQHSPYITIIDDNLKNTLAEFVESSKKGIVKFIANRMRV